MKYYSFVIAPWSIKNHRHITDVFNQTLEFFICETSFKNALSHLYKSLEFDKYIHANTTVWIYWRTHFNGKLYLVPEFEDVDIQ